MLDLESLTQFSTGTTDSMPYADEALVLMPTLDVRLIEAKVPLANAKKLQQILPQAQLSSWAEVGHAPHVHDAARLRAEIEHHRALHKVAA